MTAGGYDEDVLETVVSRKGVLLALAARPRHRREIQAEFDVSKTTCHRIIRSFDERGLVRRTDSGYEVTPVGRLVAGQLRRFEDVVERAYRLEPLLELFEPSPVAFEDGPFTDPAVNWTVQRERGLLDSGVERVRDAEVLRVLDWAPVPDLYLERIFEMMVEYGIRSEAVYPKAEVADRLERFPDRHDRLLEAGAGHRYWICEEVPPWGMTIYDDSLVELRAYEQETGAYVLDATSGDAAAVEWATDVFTDYRDRADPLTAVDDLPDWGDYSW